MKVLRLACRNIHPSFFISHSLPYSPMVVHVRVHEDVQACVYVSACDPCLCVGVCACKHVNVCVRACFHVREYLWLYARVPNVCEGMNFDVDPTHILATVDSVGSTALLAKDCRSWKSSRC